MTAAFYMNCVSTHQLPLAREVDARVDEFTYVYESVSDQVYQQAEYEKATQDKGCLETVDLVVSGLRDIELFERRAVRGLKTFYTSERWFKPIHGLPGSLRMLIPSYRRMVKRFVAWVNTDPGARVLAIGPWAKGDFLRMGVRADKLVDWGYFVEPSRFETQVADATRKIGQDLNAKPEDVSPECSESRSDALAGVQATSCPAVSPKQLKVLWAGRDIPLKHVGDIEKAVEMVNKGVVGSRWSVVGGGGEKGVGSMGEGVVAFTKLTGVTPEEVRKAMREHDVFVFASNGYEGWGAVVSEALEEGMNVIGTWECGACPTLLPQERLYHCGDVKALARLLEREYLTFTGQCTKHDARCTPLPPCSIGEWTAKKAAKRLCALA